MEQRTRGKQHGPIFFLHKAAMLMVSITRKERIIYILWAREGRKFSPLLENAVAMVYRGKL